MTKVSKEFGKIHQGEEGPRWKASFRATNILDQARRRLYEAYNSTASDPDREDVFDYLHQGVSFSASISYTIR